MPTSTRPTGTSTRNNRVPSASASSRPSPIGPAAPIQTLAADNRPSRIAPTPQMSAWCPDSTEPTAWRDAEGPFAADFRAGARFLDGDFLDFVFVATMAPTLPAACDGSGHPRAVPRGHPRVGRLSTACRAGFVFTAPRLRGDVDGAPSRDVLGRARSPRSGSRASFAFDSTDLGVMPSASCESRREVGVSADTFDRGGDTVGVHPHHGTIGDRHLPSAGVDEPMVEATKTHEVVEVGRPTLFPRDDVVGMQPGGCAAPRETTHAPVRGDATLGGACG